MSAKSDYDFSGWATRFNRKCTDGRTIRPSAFKKMDGERVPLVWNHQHSAAENVLGHADLQYIPKEGVYMYGKFNDTASGQDAKAQVQHGDITHLSIFANQLKQAGKDVLHGVIREVSLVLAGANPGAYIDDVVLAHSDDSYGEAIMYNDDELVLIHSDEDEEFEEEELEHGCGGGSRSKTASNLRKEDKKPGKKMKQAGEEAAEGGETLEDIVNTMTPKQKDALYALVGIASQQGGSMAQSDIEYDTLEEVVHSMNDQQRDALYALVGCAIEETEDRMAHSNIFEGSAATEKEDEFVLSHSAFADIVEKSKQYGSMKEGISRYAQENEIDEDTLMHGITNIDVLFPDYKKVKAEPTMIMRKNEWVSAVMDKVHHTPFSRIKTLHADLREDEARAKGYIKGNQKFEQVFPVYSRTTGPQTVYKKQGIDRDDIKDITDFDVVNYIKREMRTMLDEEIARAILIGDGRAVTHDDKIKEDNIRPIWKDDDLYVIRQNITKDASMTKEELAKELIKSCIRSRKEYRGSGNLTLFISRDLLAECLLIEDLDQRRIYKDVKDLCVAMRVNQIVEVPQFDEGLKYTPATGQQGAGIEHTLLAIAVDMSDYSVGADKGGQVDMFDDFDIDYNKHKYLIETRCSGALVDPFTAIAFNTVPANSNIQNNKKKGN